MKFILSIFLALVSIPCFADWKNHWIQAVEYAENKEFFNAELEFDNAINYLEKSNDLSHGHVYVDRARLLCMQNRFDEALINLNESLDHMKMSDFDRSRGILTRMCAKTNLNLIDDIMSDYQDYLALTTNRPQVEITKTTFIIRNVPDCKCFKETISKYLVASEICKSEDDIVFLKSNIMIAKRKKCNCGCDKSRAANPRVDNCNKVCDKVAFASTLWCSKNFKTFHCNVACISVVEILKDTCYWCCSSGNFYEKCVKPFEDILSQMGKGCDPQFD